jgi:hypothetical protein
LLKKGLQLAQKGAGKIQEKYDHINELKGQLEEYGSDQIYRIYQSASGDKKIAAGMILRERGYSKNQ